jgi:hypothetical protein
MSKQKEGIRVVIRIRPLSEIEKDQRIAVRKISDTDVEVLCLFEIKFYQNLVNSTNSQFFKNFINKTKFSWS